MTNKTNQKIIIPVIVGPTASGKSAAAIDLAKTCDGVIINCDAMQSYDALHVLTAQPSKADYNTCPHELYGHLHPSTYYNAAQWRNDAIATIEASLKNNQTPIICGGTGFYLKALMDGLSPMPETPSHIRDEVIALHNEMGHEAFFKMLQDKDPETAQGLDPHNTQRSMRAWEVLVFTGKPLSQWQKEPLIGPPIEWVFDVKPIIPERDVIHNNIRNRLDIMIDQGILDEVRALDQLIQNGDVPDNGLIIKAHGFRPFRRYLNGEWTLDQAKTQTEIETRQYAKRQVTWIKHQILK